MQNLTFGLGGGLASPCEAAYAAEPWLCFMAQHMQRFVETPMFLFNSKYDAWQLDNILQTGGLTNSTSAWGSKPVQRAVVQYGQDFLAALEPFWHPNPPPRGTRGMRSTHVQTQTHAHAPGANSTGANLGRAGGVALPHDAQSKNGGFITSCICHEW